MLTGKITRQILFEILLCKCYSVCRLGLKLEWLTIFFTASFSPNFFLLFFWDLNNTNIESLLIFVVVVFCLFSHYFSDCINYIVHNAFFCHLYSTVEPIQDLFFPVTVIFIFIILAWFICVTSVFYFLNLFQEIL